MRPPKKACPVCQFSTYLDAFRVRRCNRPGCAWNSQLKLALPKTGAASLLARPGPAVVKPEGLRVDERLLIKKPKE